MGADGGNIAHHGLGAGNGDRGQKARQRPVRRADLADAIAFVQLRMFQEGLDRVHVGVGNRRLVEPPDHLFGGKLGKMPLDQGLQRVAILHALRIAAEARVVGERRIIQHLRA